MAAAGVGQECELVLSGKDSLAAGVVRLRLADPAGGDVPGWTPGAHVDLVLRPDLVRQYSLCGDPGDRAALEVAVLREQGGRGGSVFVHDELEVGDKVTVRGPRNNFDLVEAEEYLLVAGGIGITPLRPMIEAVVRRGRPWRLVYGGRTRSSMAFGDELAAAHPGRVDVRPQDETGLLDLDGLLGRPDERTAIYCCGPEALLAAVEERCSAWPRGALHVERFSAKPAEEAGPDKAFEVELARTGRAVTVPAGVSIVDALAAEGVTVETSCREGTCGTCETAVLDGVPEHRDSLLDEDERAVGDVMFVCVSRARSDRLTLDL